MNKYSNTVKMLGVDTRSSFLFGDACDNLIKCSSKEIQQEAKDEISQILIKLKPVEGGITIQMVDALLHGMITEHAHKDTLPLKGFSIKVHNSPEAVYIGESKEKNMHTIRKRTPVFETDDFQEVFNTDSYNVFVKPEFESKFKSSLSYPDIVLRKYDHENGMTTVVADYQNKIGSKMLARVRTETVYRNIEEAPIKHTAVDNINLMIVNGNRLELPQDVKFKNYNQIKTVLENSGGKYKKLGFEFKGEAQEIFDRLVNGEKVNDKKKFQFFATPDTLAKTVVDKADIKAGDKVLEPSAGEAGIAKHIPESASLDVVEFMEENRNFLIKEGYNVIGEDFLKVEGEEVYDKIVANPPFTKNQDIKHLYNMLKLLKSGGRVVCIMSTSWVKGSLTIHKEFRDKLKELKAQVSEIEQGEFKYSGTNIATMLVIIDKP